MFRVRNTPSDTQAIFVVGAPRSGTTLVEMLIGRHSQCSGFGRETALFTFQNLFDQSRVPRGMCRARFEHLSGGATSQVDLFDRLASDLLDRSGGRYAVEKTPQHVLHLGRLTHLFPRARFIHVYRDGRNCFCSAHSSNPYVWQARRISTFAAYWRKCIRSRQRLRDERILDVCYESLTEEPVESMRTIMEFLGLDFEPAQLDNKRHAADKRVHEAAHAKLAQRVASNRPDRWRAELTESENAIFWRIAGAELRSLGYERL